MTRGRCGTQNVGSANESVEIEVYNMGALTDKEKWIQSENKGPVRTPDLGVRLPTFRSGCSHRLALLVGDWAHFYFSPLSSVVFKYSDP